MKTTYNDDIHYTTIATPVPLPSNAPVADVLQAPTHNYTISSGLTKEIDSHGIRRLKDQGFTEGLAKSLNDVNSNFPLRIWVVDNSGSMGMTDGHRLVPLSKNQSSEMKVLPCTRWKEIQDCVEYHVQLSALLAAPTTFRLLNNPGISIGSQEFDVATKGKETIDRDVHNAVNIMSKVRPSGCTPLTEHIWEINASITALKSSLEAEGKRAVVVLATDGLPTTNTGESNDYIKDQFVQSLRALEGLPVWIVIRLSTDEDSVVDFYNGLDDQLELSMDVLDDFCGEAAEIYEHNKWMNYALPLHRLREMGFHDRVLDMIDERPLTRSEVRDYCLLLFGECDGLPDPGLDWDAFMMNVKQLMMKEDYQWNPMKKKMMPWIDLKKLDKQYGNKKWFCSIM